MVSHGQRMRTIPVMSTVGTTSSLCRFLIICTLAVTCRTLLVLRCVRVLNRCQPCPALTVLKLILKVSIRPEECCFQHTFDASRTYPLFTRKQTKNTTSCSHSGMAPFRPSLWKCSSTSTLVKVSMRTERPKTTTFGVT
jgi:hypothetical protein